MIPRILHSVWIGDQTPKFDFRTSWRKVMPDFKITHWNDVNIKQEFGDDNTLKSLYNHYGPTMISDYVRLKILQRYGGVYADIDVMFLKDISKFLKNQGFLSYQFPPIEKHQIKKSTPLGLKLQECIENNIDVYEFFNTDIYCNNHIIGSAPNSKLINFFVDSFKKQLELPDNQKLSYIDYGNGPMLTTHVASKFFKLDGKTQHNQEFSLYKYDIFHPTNYIENKKARRNFDLVLNRNINKAKSLGSYAMHLQCAAEVDNYIKR